MLSVCNTQALPRADHVESVPQPEDAAKDVNLRPPKLIVAHYASQRAMDSPTPAQSNIRKSVDTCPPVMIVSYGSQSTPQAQNFHHGAYAIAQPETPHLQKQARPMLGMLLVLVALQPCSIRNIPVPDFKQLDEARCLHACTRNQLVCCSG